MHFKRFLVSSAISLSIIACSTCLVFAQSQTYTVKSGDSFYTISQKYGISTQSIMTANNATSSTILYPGQNISIPLLSHTVINGETYWTISQKYGTDFKTLLSVNNASNTSWLNIGDKVLIPSTASATQDLLHTVAKGDTFYLLSLKYKVNLPTLLSANGATEKTTLYVGQKIKIPQATSSNNSTPTTNPYVTYTTYTVQKGDNAWSIAVKFELPYHELLRENKINESTVLNIGDKLKIPVHHVPVKSTPGAKYGELLDWWTEAQYVIPRGSDFEIIDFYTGASIKARRTGGANHADCETLTLSETNKMKAIWGGNFSWTRRPVIILIDGRKIAAGMTAMPHAGVDSAQGGVWTSWRSGNYGAGINYDYIKNNGADGHFDIHFYNSTRHKDGKIDLGHQESIKTSSGITF